MPGWTIGPLKMPSPEMEEKVPLMVPYESSSSVVSTVNSPEPTRVEWLRVRMNDDDPSDV